MTKHRKTLALGKGRTRNKVRVRRTFLDRMRAANRRAKTIANRHSERKSMRHIRAAMAEDGAEYDAFTLGWTQRLIRWVVALAMLPLCYVTTLTLFEQLSTATMQRGFWYGPEFWFFSTGALLMAGWFYSGLLRRFFLHMYVLGHEYTHAIFAMLHMGRIVDLKASADGGYVATDKHNILISLSPYFFPFWAMMVIGAYGIIAWFADLPEYSDHVLYGLTGATWTFHILWTLWMIPRDQPDLRDNDTFFSLVTIYLANVLLLSAVLCFAVNALNVYAFGAAWMIHAEEFWRSMAIWLSKL